MASVTFEPLAASIDVEVPEEGSRAVMTHYIFFWDGKRIVGIEYRGLGSGPSDQDLIAIAASMSP